MNLQNKINVKGFQAVISHKSYQMILLSLNPLRGISFFCNKIVTQKKVKHADLNIFMM